MIRHHVQKSAPDAKRYYQQPDYYAEGAVRTPALAGRAAERLGVEGSPESLHFERLVDNLHPITGQPLTARQRADRIVGIDLTFDGPKSLAILEALSGDTALAEARRDAALETMQEIERAAAARVRKNGDDANRTTGNLVWYRAEHDTTRPVDGVPDMQPHEHFFVLNATFDEVEGQWKAANLYDILRDMPYYQAAFHKRLATRLEDLGYDIERKGNCFEVEGVPQSVISKFSRRQQVIEQAAQEQGITDPKAKAELGAKTREHKEKNFSGDKLRRLWIARLTQEEQEQLVQVRWQAGEREHDVPRMNGISAREAVEHAAAHLFERKSAVPARELLGVAMAYAPGHFSVNDAWKELESGDRFTAEVDGRLFVASKAVLAEEKSMIRLASLGRATQSPVNPKWEIDDTRLNIGQRAAVHHLLGSKDFVSMVIGDAGVGKTTLLKEAKRGAEATGYRVMAFAPSAAASRDTLRSEGFDGADTVTRLLVDEKMQAKARGQILLIDEAALLGTKETAQLLKLAKSLDARLWFVGDDKQHKPVGRGEPFMLLQNQAGVKAARVAKNMRQQNAEHRKAVELSKTDPAQALARMQTLGHVREVADVKRYGTMAADYLAALKPIRKGAKPKDVLVIAPTHAEGAKVTAAIRDSLRDAGQLGDDRAIPQLKNLHLTKAERADPHNYQAGDVIQFTQNAKGYQRGERLELADGQSPPTHLASRFQAYRPASLSIAEGDRLRVTMNGGTIDGHRLNNGDTLTVKGFTKSGDLLDSRGWVISKDYGHLAHGYVTTSVSSQGKSPDRVLLAMSAESLPATNREQLYVSLSRGKEWVKVYTDDVKALSRAVQRTDTDISATEMAARHDAQKAARTKLVMRVRELARRESYRSVPMHTVDSDRVKLQKRGQTIER